ncbi:MAG: inosine/xanthosine triphosphatase [Anaerolineaceae bacterium]
MKTIVIASGNPVKSAAALKGFQSMFPQEEFEIISSTVDLGIAVQPMTDEETLDGATRRAKDVQQRHPQADYWVGIEGGVADWSIGMGTFAWAVVLSKEQMGRGRSGEFFLPNILADMVRQGMELGAADDQLFSRNNSKQKNGAVGLLTGDVIDREALYVPAVVFALIPFKNPELYGTKS